MWLAKAKAGPPCGFLAGPLQFSAPGRTWLAGHRCRPWPRGGRTAVVGRKPARRANRRRALALVTRPGRTKLRRFDPRGALSVVARPWGTKSRRGQGRGALGLVPGATPPAAEEPVPSGRQQEGSGRSGRRHRRGVFNRPKRGSPGKQAGGQHQQDHSGPGVAFLAVRRSHQGSSGC